jgi:tetratricopeptide (TPR) repeat protein
VLIDLARVLVFTGRATEAVAELEEAFKQAPQVSPFIRAHLGLAYYCAGQYQKALDRLSGIPAPTFKAVLFKAASLAALGQWEEARAATAELITKSPGTTVVTLRPMLPFQDAAAQEDILANLHRSGLPE